MTNAVHNLRNAQWIQTICTWNWKLWVGWTTATMFAWPLAYGAASRILAGDVLNNVRLGSYLPFKMAVIGAVCGLIIGCIQWLALRTWRKTGGWIFWNLTGGAFGMFLWNISPFENAVGVLIYGTVVGIAQALVISWKWMFLHPVFWAGSLIVVSHIGRVLTIYLGWGAGGLAYGAMTGVVLTFLLRKR